MPHAEAVDLIRRLVAFDTTSRNSNLEMIAFIREFLADLGVESELVHNDEGNKANLYATLGPQDRPGVMLSGHTDVVPVDGQTWSTDPWTVAEADGRLYGRGTCDMKGFIALCLANAPRFLERGLETPIHFAFSYDEEVGCLGVRTLLEKMKHMPIKPAMCVVGEPTSMEVALGHKGKCSYEVTVRGYEAHSSLAPFGVNAVEYAAEVILFLRGLGERFAAEGPFDDAYDVTHTTVHTGTVEGGTALNIVPRRCSFKFEFRNIAPHDRAEIWNEIERHIREDVEPRMQAKRPETGIDVEVITEAPGLDTAPDADVVSFVKALAGRNDDTKVAFATEGGLFHERVGVPTVICGPGNIEQAHKPDEWVALEQIDQCQAFMDRLMEKVCST